MKHKHIVVIEDEKDIQEVIEYNLLREGYRVSVAEDGNSGLEMVRRERPDLVLLDIMLPGLDGLELCRTLKNDTNTRAIPIIMVTAKGEESTIVQGLDFGADDYVVKPFSPKVLMARVKATLRRAIEDKKVGSTFSFAIGPLKIDPDRFLVQLFDQTISMTNTEFRILHKLASQPSRGFAAELSAATIVVLASGTGIPVSTTHTLVGAVFGVGLAIIFFFMFKGMFLT